MNVRARLKDKLKNRQGDTLVESLTAILIAALGAAALATMIMASVSVAASNEKALTSMYAAESSMQDAFGAGGSVTISLQDMSGIGNIPVDVYKSTDNTFYRYEPQPTTEADSK